VTPAGQFTIFMPEGLAELLQVRGRWCRGNAELLKRFPALAVRDRRHYATAIWRIVTKPSLWPATPVFLLVFAIGALLSWWTRGRGTQRWERATRARRFSSQRVES
jgi:hypothetical protein